MKKAKSVLVACVAMAAMASSSAQSQEAPETDSSQASLAARFNGLDANRDGRLTPQEYLGPRWRAWGRHARGESMTLEQCALAEAEDRQASGEAFSGAGGQSPEALCSIIDKGRDGGLSWGEFGAPAWEMFKRLDVNGDGFLTYAEYSANGMAPHRAAAAPPEPSAAVKAMIQRDLARSNAPGRMVASPDAGMAPAAQAGSPSGQGPLGEPGEPADEGSRLQGISSNIQNWLK